MTVTKEMIEAAKAETAEEVLGLLTAHELYQYRPKAFQGFIDYVRKHFATASLSRSAEAGKRVVKGLEWEDASTNWRMAKSIIGTYAVWPSSATNFVGQWLLQLSSKTIDLFPSEGEAKAAAQEHFNAAIRSALSTPADIEPVAWIAKSRWEQMTAAEPWLTNTVYSEDQSRSFPCVPLYAAPVADGER